MITREFKLYLNAGTNIAPVINANQFDQDEEWIFTLLQSDGTVYTPSTGAIIGLKQDGTTILNAGTVNSSGQVVITETEQMTAVPGSNLFEILIDGNTHGTANFVVFVERRPGDIDNPSESDISLFQEAIEAAGNVTQFQADISALQSGLATTNANLTSEANTRASADATLQSNISAEASTRQTQDAVLQAEIDQIIAPTGEAPSAAEVQNARIGVDGTTYDTLGNAIRGQVGDLKNALGELIYSVKPIAGHKYIHIPIADSIATGVTIFSQALNTGTEISSVFLVGTWSNGVRDIIDLSDGKEHFFTTAVTYTSVEVVYTLVGTSDGNTTYRAVCLTSADPISVTKELFNDKLRLDHISQLLDTPFDAPISEKFKGIIGFEFLITPYSDIDYSAINNQKYRITNIYYKDSFYLYMSMQRLVNGEWVSYDNITILLANAPTENGLMFAESNYQRFRVAYIPGLMQAGRATSVEYTIKNTSINPFLTKTQDEFNRYVPYDSFEIKPTIKTRVTVKKDGTGDYTTIGGAYSAISSKSSFFNQYEICVYPGTYDEYNLICPAYSHTHGMFPNTVTVTSEGKTGTLPVFDQTGYPSRLSNMKIISATGYCIHIDNPLIHSVVNENLYCKKVYASDVSDFGWESISTSAIIGMGAQPAGMMIVFDGCTFENGAVVCHTNSSSDENADFSLIFNNCKVLNARIQLNKAGNTGAALYGNWLCKINNLAMIKGQTNPGIALFYGDAVSGMDYNFGWQIIGGNINTAIEFKKGTDMTAPDCWDNIELTEKSYVQAKSAITKGQWITDGMIPATANEKAHNIVGVALEDASLGDTCQIWAGNAFVINGTDGEYGIDSSGNLSSSATEKIGNIKNNIFYRY